MEESAFCTTLLRRKCKRFLYIKNIILPSIPVVFSHISPAFGFDFFAKAEANGDLLVSAQAFDFHNTLVGREKPAMVGHIRF